MNNLILEIESSFIVEDTSRPQSFNNVNNLYRTYK